MNNQNYLTWNIGRTRKIVFLSMWSAILIVMALIPNVGYIMINPTITLTTLQIPVIIGAIMMGPKEGAFLGLVFGVTSMLQAPLLEAPTAFLFNPFVQHGNYESAIIAIVPRVLIGIVAAYVFKLVARFDKRKIFACVTAAIAGGLTTSVLVLGGIYLFFKADFAAVIKQTASVVIYVLLTTFVTNSILEIAVTAVAVTAICKALFAVMKRNNLRKA